MCQVNNKYLCNDNQNCKVAHQEIKCKVGHQEIHGYILLDILAIKNCVNALCLNSLISTIINLENRRNGKIFEAHMTLYVLLHLPENVVSKDFCQINDFNGRTPLFSSDKHHICGVFLSFIHLL